MFCGGGGIGVMSMVDRSNRSNLRVGNTPYISIHWKLSFIYTQGYLEKYKLSAGEIKRYATPKYACAKASTVLLLTLFIIIFFFSLLLYKTFKTGSVAIRRVFNECLGTRGPLQLYSSFFFFFFDLCPNFHLKKKEGVLVKRYSIFVRSIASNEYRANLDEKNMAERSCFAIR